MDYNKDSLSEIEEKRLPMFANYKGKQVYIQKANPKVVETTIADAERIMGTRKTLKGSFLEPPQKDSELWEYANALLTNPSSSFVLAGGNLRSLNELDSFIYE